MTLSSFSCSNQILYPPIRDKISENLPKPLIAILGPSYGIAIGQSWHQQMIVALNRSGYKDAIYIPERVDADICDHSEELNKLEDRNNQFAIGRSTKVIYWQPSSIEVDLPLYTLALHELSKAADDTQKRVFFGGGHSVLGRSLAAVSDNVSVYHSMDSLCSALMKTL